MNIIQKVARFDLELFYDGFVGLFSQEALFVDRRCLIPCISDRILYFVLLWYCHSVISLCPRTILGEVNKRGLNLSS